MNVVQREREKKKKKKKGKDDKVPRRDRHRPKQRGETPKSAWDKIPKMHKRTRINSVCQQTFSKSLTEREEHPTEDLDATHAIIKGKGK